MKKTLLTITFGLSLAIGMQAQTFVDEDFNASGSSLPANWTSDPSGLWQTGVPDNVIPNALGLLGASLNAPGHESVAGINGNSNANNAILSSPSFDIPASETGTYVTFDYAYMGVSYRNTPTLIETATLLYTTNGGTSWNTLEDLTASGSADPWNSNSVSLASLAGVSNIQIGFRYENVDTVLVGIAIDNFKVFVPPANDIALLSVAPLQGDLSAYGLLNDGVNLSGVVQNNGSSTITSYTVFYQDGNNAPVSSQQSTSIAPFEVEAFGNISFKVASLGATNLKVWVELSGDNIATNDSALAYVEGVSFKPTKRILFEEATGTWCGWCPRGSHNMRLFAENNPGAASQVAVHNGVGTRFDPMVVPAYDALVTSLPGFSGFPGMAVDRRFTGDPGNIEAMYQDNKDNFGFADVNLDKPTFNGNQVSVVVDIKAAVEINGAKLALIITEDSVTGTGTGWAQVNYYAGGGRGPMGGYESKPANIFDEVYEFVGRSITPAAGGGASGLPATMVEGQNYTATLNANLSSNWNKNKLSYIVALIDQNGEVLNTNHYLYITGLNDVKLGLSNAIIYPNPVADNAAYLNVSAESNMEGTITVRDIRGRIVNTISNVNIKVGQNTIELPTSSLTSGIYMVSFQSEKGILNLKLQVTK